MFLTQKWDSSLKGFRHPETLKAVSDFTNFFNESMRLKIISVHLVFRVCISNKYYYYYYYCTEILKDGRGVCCPVKFLRRYAHMCDVSNYDAHVRLKLERLDLIVHS